MNAHKKKKEAFSSSKRQILGKQMRRNAGLRPVTFSTVYTTARGGVSVDVTKDNENWS